MPRVIFRFSDSRAIGPSVYPSSTDITLSHCTVQRSVSQRLNMLLQVSNITYYGDEQTGGQLGQVSRRNSHTADPDDCEYIICARFAAIMRSSRLRPYPC